MGVDVQMSQGQDQGHKATVWRKWLLADSLTMSVFLVYYQLTVRSVEHGICPIAKFAVKYDVTIVLLDSNFL